MQAIIMAAGKGSRLAPMNVNRPKSFVEINGHKLLDYQLAIYKRLEIEEVIIVTGYRSDLIESHVKDIPYIKTVYNPFYEFSNVLASFWMGMEYLKGDFFYSHADTIFDLSIINRIQETKGDIILPVDIKRCGEEEMKVSLDQNGKINFINKTMTAEEALGEFIGVAKISNRALPVLKEATRKQMQDQNLKAFFEVALQDLINEQKELFAIADITGEYWNEIDFVEDYNKAVQSFKQSSLSQLFE
ncbi:NTP transferase domain-containing protein [Cohnella thailandensis]|uniref:Phosphocholine cytidylyltransferase family protein n=1 Tax=Cohnella thailandensis TaxID=557557 RepID=A0A841SSH8_9BACL|nr:phosphocholine cytidylyltransferase family protein [Cohnella thailandensis]MBB6632577.1 phosphocholine cytidylyltransferase family protein [Cohnella thailandensis]MBP1971871.1 choline kinase [Cohnella thailandensis]